MPALGSRFMERLVFILLVTSCLSPTPLPISLESGTVVVVDAGHDAGILPEVDAGIGVDAGHDAGSFPNVDAGMDADASTLECSSPCPSNWSCVRGTCIKDCGADVAALEAALHPGLRVGVAICAEVDAYVVPRDIFYGLSSSATENSHEFTLGWSDEACGGCLTPVRHWSVAVASGATIRPSAFLAPANHKGNLDSFVFGYRTDDAAGPGKLIGYFTEQGVAHDFELEAKGLVMAVNFRQRKEVLVSATQVGEVLGAGVYVFEPATNTVRKGVSLGTASPGSVAVFGDDETMLLVGVTLPDGDAVIGIYAELLLGGGPLEALTDLHFTRRSFPAHFAQAGPKAHCQLSPRRA